MARQATGGKGVNVVYDSVGPAVWSASIKSLAPRGYYVNFGNASGPLAPIDSGELQMAGSLFFTKASMRYYQLTRQELEDSAAALFDVIAKGVVKPVIGQRYQLVDAVARLNVHAQHVVAVVEGSRLDRRRARLEQRLHKAPLLQLIRAGAHQRVGG